MAIQGRDLCKLGWDLYSFSKKIGATDCSADHEVYLRTAINRAYYGAFLEARKAANLEIVSNDVHKKVIDAHANSSVGNRLSELKSLRQKADYKNMEDVQIRETVKALKIADRILKNLQK